MTSDAKMGRAERAGRVHAWNAAANLGLALSKLLVGWLAGSSVLLADGVHSATDLVSNAIAWIGHRVAQIPPDEDHHHGHGGAEALAACAVGLVVMAGGVGVVWNAFGVAGGVEPGTYGTLAVVVATASAVVCAVLAAWTLRVGRALNSPSLTALGRDKRSDSLTSLIVLVGIVCALVGLPWLEPWIAAGIGVYVTWLGGVSFREGLDVLMDRVPEPGIQEELRDLALQVPGVQGACRVRVHPLGSTWAVELEIVVDGELTVAEGHKLAHEVEARLTRARDRIVRVQVHVNPA